MNDSDSNLDPTTEEQAALWAARLDGDNLSNDSRLELETWLNGHAQRRTLLAEYCQFSTDLETVLPMLAATGCVETTLPAAPRPRHRWRPWVAGAGLLTASLAAIFWFAQPRDQFENIATPVAQRQSLVLIDGSKLELDARTSLSVEIDATTRRIRLADGEAFFAVTKDPSRPFVVETPLGSVRVKGTKFDVRATSPTALVVTVQEGVVQINPSMTGIGSAPILLHAADQLTLDGSGVAVKQLSPHDLDDTLAWRQGQVVFKGVPLDEALARFARHHGIGITASPAASRLRIGGRFSLDDLNGFLTALEEVVPVQVSRNLNGTVQVNLRPDTAPSSHGK